MKNNDIRICTSCHFLFEGNPNYGCCPDCVWVVRSICHHMVRSFFTPR